jgi:hypothetical protein
MKPECFKPVGEYKAKIFSADAIGRRRKATRTPIERIPIKPRRAGDLEKKQITQ